VRKDTEVPCHIRREQEIRVTGAEVVKTYDVYHSELGKVPRNSRTDEKDAAMLI
jgi:hypothetical protein